VDAATLHLVALPHTQTDGRFLTCAYTQKVVKFCRMMAPTYEVILYAGDQNVAPCSEHVPLFSEDERVADWGDGFDTVADAISWDPSIPYWSRMNERAIDAIRERARPRDLLLVTGGWAQKPLADRLDLIACEWAVGYEGIFSDYCAFESAAWMHHIYGRQGWGNGRFYDAVIPNYFDPDDFAVAPKDDYLLFVGRLVERKGVHVAAQIAGRVGMRLLVAGPGIASARPGEIVALDGTRIVGPVEYVGEVDAVARRDLMAGARALLAPTLYVEPFGGVTVEAMLSGTPVVTTDWGAYTETVTADVGRRFRTLQQGVEATRAVLDLDPLAVRAHALARYSLDAVRPRFDVWFAQLAGLWGEGWAA